jgi:hypothetical protein
MGAGRREGRGRGGAGGGGNRATLVQLLCALEAIVINGGGELLPACKKVLFYGSSEAEASYFILP